MGVIQFTEPAVKQTTVTVQNVMIGKRQLTQRVFKQILHQEIFDEESNTLQGDAWGYVNYFWKGASGHNNKHILWITSGGELRRHLVIKDLEYWKGHKYEHAAIYLITKLPQLFIAV